MFIFIIFFIKIYNILNIYYKKYFKNLFINNIFLIFKKLALQKLILKFISKKLKTKLVKNIYRLMKFDNL